MKLNNAEFKRFKELQAKRKLTSEEEKELALLSAKKNEKGSNAIEWWKNYPALLDSVSKVPFNYIPGTDFIMANHAFAIGSVFRVAYLPTVGRNRKTSDGFNAQMRQLWLDMHRKYRGMGGYQRADLGMMIIAIQSVFTTLAKFERIYTVINTYKIANRAIPYGLFEALGIGKTLPGQLAQFRAELNLRIAKLQQLCLPKGIAAIEADITMALGLYKDSENARAATFCFDPDYFGLYDATALSTGGCVGFEKFSDNNMNDQTPSGYQGFDLGDIINVLDSQINALLDDDDVAKMCSDLIAAYGPENVMTVGFLEEHLTCEPIYDYERLLQLHNLTIVGSVYTQYNNSAVTSTEVSSRLANNKGVVVYQYNDIIYNELVCVGEAGSNGQVISQGGYFQIGDSTAPDQTGPQESVLDTWVEQPGDMEVVCGTRLTSLASGVRTFTSGGNTVVNQEVVTFGTAVVISVKAYRYDATSNKFIDSSGYLGTCFDSGNVGLSQYLDLHALDWAPIFQCLDGDGDSEYHLVGDIDNCTVLSLSILNKIHDVAVYSAYKIPNVAYIS